MERSGKLPYEEHTNRLIHTHRIRREDVLAMLQEKYCKLPSGDMYLKAMRQYYHNRLQHEPDI